MIKQGDALTLIRKVKSKSISLVIADPPFQVSKPNNKFNETWDYGFVSDEEWLTQADRVLKDSGSIVIFHKWQRLGDLDVVLTNKGFDVKDRLTWIKTNPRRMNQGRRFLADVENMLWAVKRCHL